MIGQCESIKCFVIKILGRLSYGLFTQLTRFNFSPKYNFRSVLPTCKLSHGVHCCLYTTVDLVRAGKGYWISDLISRWFLREYIVWLYYVSGQLMIFIRHAAWFIAVSPLDSNWIWNVIFGALCTVKSPIFGLEYRPLNMDEYSDWVKT